MIVGTFTGIIALIFVIAVIIWLVKISPYKIIHSTSKKHTSVEKLLETFLKLN